MVGSSSLLFWHGMVDCHIWKKMGSGRIEFLTHIRLVKNPSEQQLRWLEPFFCLFFIQTSCIIIFWRSLLNWGSVSSKAHASCRHLPLRSLFSRCHLLFEVLSHPSAATLSAAMREVPSHFLFIIPVANNVWDGLTSIVVKPVHTFVQPMH